MDHLLPPPFYKHMSKLQDKAKAASLGSIKAVFQEDIGKPVEEIFAEFDPEPIASASLAQVHKAKLRNGQDVAVKIQKPNIRKQFQSDMWMHYMINWVLEKAFDLPLLHFVDDIQASLKKELDFRI
jgi:aarF domain-containing kinase